MEAAATNTSITLKGDLGIGDNSVGVDMATATLTQAVTVSLSGLSNYDASDIQLSGDVNSTVTLGGGTSVDTLTFTAVDKKATISGFDTTEDKLDFGLGKGGTAVAANAAATTVSIDEVYVFADGADGTLTEAIASYSDLTDVAAFIAAAFSDEAALDTFVAVINDLVGDKTYAYYVDFDAGNGGVGALDADALTLIGVITEESGAALVVGDIV